MKLLVIMVLTTSKRVQSVTIVLSRFTRFMFGGACQAHDITQANSVCRVPKLWHTIASVLARLKTVHHSQRHLHLGPQVSN